ncbi:molecular chaperone DnaJ [Kitasatospora sp. NBC_00315]|uniref:molecular chaperone DnaJ n=1 Tax=Kitasatospora sp. NBC_00315 TaxID=2975963 RepID=UPI00324F3227
MSGPGAARPPAEPRTFAEALAAVTAARHPDDLFPPAGRPGGARPTRTADATPTDPGARTVRGAPTAPGGPIRPGDAGRPDEAAAAARRYRRLARLLHPDGAPAAQRAAADEAFVALGRLWHLHLSAGAPLAEEPELTTARHHHRLGPTLATGDIAVLRSARSRPRRTHDGPAFDAVIKIPGASADNDLMEREATALTRLATHGDPRHRAYTPTLLDSFHHRDAADPGEEPRLVNALDRLDGFHPLTDVRDAHPGGLDPRDAAWIWRRLLVALGHAHRAGVRHGAVLPEHVLIHPAQHGLVLVDWCYATTGRYTPAPALVERHRAWYPPEIPARRPVTEATDIHLASRCVEYLMGEQAPKALRAFVAGCTLPAEARRPHDAWKLLAELDDLLERLFGPRTFRPLRLPPRPAAAS